MTAPHLPGSVPSSNPPPRLSPRSQRERGGCLNLWLAVSAIFALLSAFLLVQILNTIANRPEISLDAKSWLSITLFGALILATLVCLRAIALWRKWGVYGMVIVSIATPFIKQGLTTVGLSDWLAPFVQIGILFFLVSSQWDYFE